MITFPANESTVATFGERERQFCRICRAQGRYMVRVVNAGDRAALGDRSFRAMRRAAFAKHANEVHPELAARLAR